MNSLLKFRLFAKKTESTSKNAILASRKENQRIQNQTHLCRSACFRKLLFQMFEYWVHRISGISARLQLMVTHKTETTKTNQGIFQGFEVRLISWKTF